MARRAKCDITALEFVDDGAPTFTSNEQVLSICFLIYLMASLTLPARAHLQREVEDSVAKFLQQGTKYDT